jgi:hypothetical protein
MIKRFEKDFGTDAQRNAACRKNPIWELVSNRVAHSRSKRRVWP